MSQELTCQVGLALALILLVVLLAHAYARTGLAREAFTAALRSVLQLGIAALVIAAAIQHLVTSLLVILLMFVMAAVTTTGRIGAERRCTPWAGLAIASGLVPVVGILLLSTAVPLTGIALIPVCGILIGNAMSGHTLFGRRAFSALHDELGQYEAYLSVGLESRAAVSEITHRRIPEGLVTGLDGVRTAGVVTLPGAFIGVLLGGGSPAQAAVAQVLVLFGIMAVQAVTVVVEERLIARRLIVPADLRASLVS